MNEMQFKNPERFMQIVLKVCAEGNYFERSIAREGSAESGPYALNYAGFRFGRLFVEKAQSGSIWLCWIDNSGDYRYYPLRGELYNKVEAIIYATKNNHHAEQLGAIMGEPLATFRSKLSGLKIDLMPTMLGGLYVRYRNEMNNRSSFIAGHEFSYQTCKTEEYELQKSPAKYGLAWAVCCCEECSLIGGRLFTTDNMSETRAHLLNVPQSKVFWFDGKESK